MGMDKFVRLVQQLKEKMGEKEVQKVLGYELNQIDDEMLSQVFGGVSIEQLGNMDKAELQKILEEQAKNN